jgi:hypothetical protein
MLITCGMNGVSPCSLSLFAGNVVSERLQVADLMHLDSRAIASGRPYASRLANVPPFVGFVLHR